MESFAPHNNLQLCTDNRQILKMALPISLAILVPQLNFVANTIFLGDIGEQELGAAGITGVFYLIFALIGNGLNSGIQALIARRAGENRPEEMGRILAQSIWIAFGFAIASMIITWTVSPYFFKAVIANPKICQEAIDFTRIRILGLPFLYLFQVCNALMVGSNNSKFMKYGFTIEALLNIFLDFVLIKGRWGFPAIGFNGAAIASICAEAAGFIVAAYIIYKNHLHTRFAAFAHTRFNKPLAKLIFRQSSPLVLQFVLSVSAWLLFYLLIEKYGTRSLAISNTMRNLFGIFGIFMWAFASTCNAMVSNIIGQGRKDEVLTLVPRIARLSFSFTLVLTVLVNLFPYTFLSIYGQSQEFIADSIPVLRLISLALLTMSISTVWLNAVTGTANTTVNLLIEIITIVAYTIYVYFVLHVWKLSLVWAWGSEFVYWIFILTMAYFYMKSGRWRKKEI